ncbi:Mus81 protein [Candida orthopsilosis Co 90-125]|uniref:Crossover junction endonuclease MUS81 n=1 Tax=Candida orthopsilosis (strain 90-125) TaxID=1136231 RepID=H8X9M1_CANO9|nr:Mus81 protein [Candida orthopsilosis Co 90-125]CCG24687.1 Mus81 protein [Candida orthopsilosis Co 90-125]
MSDEVPEDFKQYIIQWIETDAIEATKNGSKMAVLYNKMLGQIRRTPGPIVDTKSLKQIKFVGVKTAVMLSNRVLQLCKANGWEPPVGFMDEAEAHKSALSKTDQLVEEDSSTRPVKRARTVASYVPKQRSGAFAIMVTLYLRDREGRGMTREQISQHAAPYSDKSFTTSTTSMYSAWDSIKTLIKRELVYVTGRSPKMYYLTEEGRELASKLKTAVNIESSPMQSNTIANSSFDNGVRFESSFEKSSPIVNRNIDLASDRQSSIRLHNSAHNSRLVSEVLPPTGNIVHDSQNRIYDGTPYEIWTKDEYEVIIYIDNREIRAQQERDFFRRQLELANIKCDVKALACGDITWVARHLRTGREAVLNYLCERKRIDDLCDSIKDGRFLEQKNRMKKSGMMHCFYLVEEVSLVKERAYAIMDSIQTGIAQTMTNARLYLRRFKDIDETIEFLASLTGVIKDVHVHKNLVVLRPRDIYNQDHYNELLVNFREKFETRANYECCHLFSSFQEMMGKTTQMTVRELFILMLMTIKGCSLEKAIVIQNRFPTPKRLLDFYHQQNAHAPLETKKQLMVDEFKTQVGNKKIGKVLSEKIYDIWGT